MKDKATLTAVWNQQTIPVIFIRNRGPVRFRLPYTLNARTFIQSGNSGAPTWDWNRKYWMVPRSWFDDLVSRILKRHKKAYIIREAIGGATEVCAPACWSARGFECVCSCLGERHGEQQPEGRWYIVSETFAISLGETQYSVRLLNGGS